MNEQKHKECDEQLRVKDGKYRFATWLYMNYYIDTFDTFEEAFLEMWAEDHSGQVGYLDSTIYHNGKVVYKSGDKITITVQNEKEGGQ